MKLNCRPFKTEEDYWRLRDFLRRVFIANDRQEWCWHVARLDYCRWHAHLNCNGLRFEDVVFIWETGDNQIAAAIIAEDPGDVHLQIHPQFRTAELEAEMLALAEDCLAVDIPDGGRRLNTWTPEVDQLRTALLRQRGYHQAAWPEYQFRCSLDAPVPEVPVAAGYTIRSLGDGLELLERCYASGLAFHDDDILTARNNRSNPAWYRNIQTAPLYRRDLDIVAAAPSGEIAAFCTIWFDDVTRSAYFEPVATVPAHQRRGLGKAVMTEGLLRLKRMGAEVAFVSGFSERAGALYSSVMRAAPQKYVCWVIDR